MKNMKIYSLVLISMVLGLVGCQEDSGLSDLQKDSFFKYYGGPEIDEGRDLVQLDDGSYVILGTKTRLQQIGDGIQTAVNTDIVLIKTDVFGNKTWEREFEGGSGDLDSAIALKVDDNNGFVIAGTVVRVKVDPLDTTIVQKNLEMILIKTGEEGNLEWQRQYGTDNADLYCRDMIILDNGDYLLSGIESRATSSEAIVIQVTGGTAGLGEEIRRGSTESLTGIPSGALAVSQALDGTAYVIGETENADYPNGDFQSDNQAGINLFVAKLAANGQSVTFIDNVTFGGVGMDVGYAICPSEDGGFIIAGSSEGHTNGTSNGEADFFVIKKPPLDGSSSETSQYEWTNLYGGADDDIAYSVIQTNDGGYLLAGVTSSFGNNRQQYIVKLDATGALQWEKTFGFTSIDEAFSVIQTSDGGYAFVGSANDGAGNSMICLFKLTSSGELK